jgi:hypothetical protein
MGISELFGFILIERTVDEAIVSTSDGTVEGLGLSGVASGEAATAQVSNYHMWIIMNFLFLYHLLGGFARATTWFGFVAFLRAAIAAAVLFDQAS